MTDAPDKPVKRRPWGKIVLFLSLALNLLIIGLVLGAVSGGPRDRDRSPALRDLGYGPFVQALARSDRQALSAAIRAESGSLRENRAALRAQFEAILGALRADPFDAEAFNTLVVDQRSRVSERVQIGQDLLLKQIAQMTPDDRAAYADALDKSLKRRGKPGRNK